MGQKQHSAVGKKINGTIHPASVRVRVSEQQYSRLRADLLVHDTSKMPKATDLPNLNLTASIRNVSELDDGIPGLSPHSTGSRTPRSASSSPRLQSTNISSVMNQIDPPLPPESKTETNGHTSPRITAVPDLPPSPTSNQPTPKHGREPSKSFFSNLVASKSSHKLHASETSLPDTAEKLSARSRASSKDRSLYSIRKQGSTPELPRYNAPLNHSSHSAHESIASTNTQEMAQGTGPAGKKNKSKLGGMLTRTKTMRGEENSKQRAAPPGSIRIDNHTAPAESIEPPPRTAPLKSDHRARAFGGSNGTTPRNRSADRTLQNDSKPIKKDNRQTQHMPLSQSFQGGSNLLSNIQQTGKGVGDRLGKAGKGWLGKITRSGSSVEREAAPPEEHVISIIHLPLIKQTRRTRIARRLELSKDKTEFWMPALPWRCIE